MSDLRTPTVSVAMIERGARELWRLGNERIGDRAWEQVRDHYRIEAEACLRAALAVRTENVVVSASEREAREVTTDASPAAGGGPNQNSAGKLP